jgi:type IX secretion system PorP/SprF family membrane protein
MNKILTLLLLIVLQTSLYAQQDPHYTQYMYNMNVINPAYAGSKENLSFGVLYRRQWIEIQDAPTTFSASGSSPIGKNVGVGLSIISDEIGPVAEQNVYGDFSYTIDVSDKHKLAFGLKAGFTIHKVDFGKIKGLPVPTEAAFQNNVNNVYANIGSGLFFYSDNYYISLSVPNIVNRTHLNVGQNDGRIIKYGDETQHFFLAGGYVFNLNENLKFKPHTMIKSAFNAPTSIDLSANFLFNEVFELGATWRREDSFGAMVNYAITPNVRVGYAYDHVVSDLKVTTPSSHEVILLFDLNFPKKVSRSSRYF